MSRADEEDIRRVIAEMTEASNRNDAKAVTRMHAVDADFVTVRGKRFTGAAEIEQGLTVAFATRGATPTVKTLNVTVRFLRPDVAIAHVTNELSGLVSPEGQQLPAQQELSIRVFTKEEEDAPWCVTAFHNTLLRS